MIMIYIIVNYSSIIGIIRLAIIKKKYKMKNWKQYKKKYHIIFSKKLK